MYVHQYGIFRADPPQVHNKSHLLALSRVCKQFRSLVFPRLFEVLTIRSRDELFLWEPASYPFFDQDIVLDAPKVFTAVKELNFAASFNGTNLGGHEGLNRCPHFSITESYSSPNDSPSSETDDSSFQEGDDSTYENKQGNMMNREKLYIIVREEKGLIRLSKKIIRLLSVLPDNQLRSFR